MVITTTFSLAVPIETAWRFLLDVRNVAECMPGAQLTEVIDERTYNGKVEVKLGPIGVSYKGQVHLEEIDEATHTVRIKAQGAEARGRGGASAMVTSEMRQEGDSTTVVMNTDLAVSGVVAQFGRSGIMQEVAQRMSQRFANCVEQTLKAGKAAG